jgi:outer membrane protein with beta-barrel domain
MRNSPLPGVRAGGARWLAILAVALAAAPTAGAQERRLEVGGNVGWTFSDGVRRAGGLIGTSGLFTTGVEPENGVSYAFFASYFVNENVQLGFQLGRQESELRVTGEPPVEAGSIGVENYHAVSTVLMGDDELQARPYFLFGLGVTRYSRVNFTGLDGVPRAFEGRTRFSPTFGTGAKFYLRSHKYGLNLGVRWTPTFLKSGSEGFWCDPYWGCFTADNSQFAHQVEFAAGIQLRF